MNKYILIGLLFVVVCTLVSAQRNPCDGKNVGDNCRISDDAGFGGSTGECVSSLICRKTAVGSAKSASGKDTERAPGARTKRK